MLIVGKMKVLMCSTVCPAEDDPNLDCAKAFNKLDNVQKHHLPLDHSAINTAFCSLTTLFFLLGYPLLFTLRTTNKHCVFPRNSFRIKTLKS